MRSIGKSFWVGLVLAAGSLGAGCSSATDTPVGAGTAGTSAGGSVLASAGAPGSGASTAGTSAGGTAAGGTAAAGAATGYSTTGGAAGGGMASGGSATVGGAATGGFASSTAGAASAGSAGASTFPISTGKPTVYIAGDSTVSTYPTGTQQGWGQRLKEYFTADVIVVNKAISGRSSKSFVDEGHLKEILDLIKPGDYLLAQWGINDRSVAGPERATDPATTFRTYLKQYIDGARSKNAIPVLITPTPRHQYSNGMFQNGFPEYCKAIIAVGAETNTPVIDLQAKGLAYYTMIGDDAVTKTIALDALHFTVEGANQMARLVAQGVQEIKVPISQFVISSKLAP